MKLNYILLFTSLLINIRLCNEQNNKSNPPEDNLERVENKNSNKNEILNFKSSMLEYIEMSKPSYTKDNVEELIKILNDYTAEIANANSKEEGLNIVKVTVEKLNKLNEKCDYQLIETIEREQIAAIIIVESSKRGYNKQEDDITEKWREL